ncbi:MAG: TetR/AcrR family transcriptional regulator [Acidimicrobiia bacterium]|nr:TetR/AcrR family transcriptional regulator [Acidimicrobiia bacterium]
MATRTSTAELRDAMFDAARDLIARIGYSEMSHADITYAVGIGRTTFYEHFSSKEDLLIQLVRRDLPQTTEEILASVDPDLPPDQHLGQLAARMVEFVGTDHMGLILHTEVPRLSPEAQRDIAEAHEGLASEFANVYRAGVIQGIFKAYPPRLAGKMIEQIIMTGGKVVMDSDDPKGQVAAIAEDTAALLVDAFRVRDSV